MTCRGCYLVIQVRDGEVTESVVRTADEAEQLVLVLTGQDDPGDVIAYYVNSDWLVIDRDFYQEG